MTDRPLKDETLLAHAGNKPQANFGIVNPPVYHASTILFPTVAALEEMTKDKIGNITYGRFGTPTTFAFEEAVASLEGADQAIAMPSGLAAVAGSLLSFLRTGDHLLMTDSVYGPVRSLCDTTLKGLGIETTYYDPLIGAGIAELIRPATRVIYLESPGSLTFEVQDIRGDRRRRAPGRLPHDDGQQLGHAALLQAAGPRRRHLHSCGHQIYRRSFRCDDGAGTLPGGSLPAAEDGHARARLLRRAGRLLSGAAGPAHARRPPRAPPGDRAGCSPAGCRAAGGGARSPPRPARRSRPCPLAARLRRQQRAVRPGPEALPARGPGRHARRHDALRHGLQLGRL